MNFLVQTTFYWVNIIRIIDKGLKSIDTTIRKFSSISYATNFKQISLQTTITF